jgi:hypothetical protein
VQQGKTGAKLRIVIEGDLADLLLEIREYKRAIAAERKAAGKPVVHTMALLVNETGREAHEANMLRNRFDDARERAGVKKDLFQFRDFRAKVATETDEASGTRAAQALLGTPPRHVHLYTPGKWASGTPQDAAAMADAAFTGWVFLMRRHGQRLPARHVGEPIQGQVLLINRYEEEDRFYVRLYHPGQFMDWSHELHGARIERSNGGVHLLRATSGSRPPRSTSCRPGCACRPWSAATRSCARWRRASGYPDAHGPASTRTPPVLRRHRQQAGAGGPAPGRQAHAGRVLRRPRRLRPGRGSLGPLRAGPARAPQTA